MSFERWNAFLQEQLGKKQGQTPPQPAQGKNESEVERIGKEKEGNTSLPIQQ